MNSTPYTRRFLITSNTTNSALGAWRKDWGSPIIQIVSTSEANFAQGKGKQAWMLLGALLTEDYKLKRLASLKSIGVPPPTHMFDLLHVL